MESMDPVSTIYYRALHRIDPQFTELLLMVPELRLPTRKAMLSCCQMQMGPLDNPRLKEEFLGSFPDHSPRIYFQLRPDVSKFMVMNIIHNSISDSHIKASILSSVLRSAPEVGFNDSDLAMQEGVMKEYMASRTPFANDQVNCYSSILPLFNSIPTQQNIEYPITPPWASFARVTAKTIAKRFYNMHRHCLFPQVQRRKNMSQETCRTLLADGYDNPDCLFWSMATTRDLQRHYHSTGARVGGSCEMRVAWRYNDLKPRVYYAIGGDAYWSACYMKEIAIALMECFPPSRLKTRMDPSIISYFIDPDQDVLAWDYTSFTTTLSELKFFTFYLAEYLSEQESCTYYRFDYRHGIVPFKLGEMIHDYNRNVNVLQDYSLHRVLDILGLDPGDMSEPKVVQENSGMLGVPGNIGLSTSLHAAHITPGLRDARAAVSLGDDACGGISDKGRFLRLLAWLGVVHPEKMYHLPPTEYDEEHVGKLVKRRLTRTEAAGLSILELFDFPIVAQILGYVPKNRTVPADTTLEDRQATFISQVSSLLWKIHSSYLEVDDLDLRILQSVLQFCYRTLHLPPFGAFPYSYKCYLPPNQQSQGLDHAIPHAIPSIDFEKYDPRRTDWAEFLWSSRPSRYFGRHLTSPLPMHVPRDIVAGAEFLASESKYCLVLQDLKYVEKKEAVVEWVMAEEENRRLFKEALRPRGIDRSCSSYKLNMYVCIRDPPDYHVQVVDHLSPNIGPDFGAMLAGFDYVLPYI